MVPNEISHIENEISDSFAIQFWLEKNSGETISYRLIYNRIFLITDGSGEILVDGQNFTVSSNLLLLVAKGQIITFAGRSKFTGYELTFGDCFWDRAPSSEDFPKL